MLKLLNQKFAVSDPEQYLKADHLTADLKRHSVRGGVATLGSQMFRFALQMGTTGVLARLLAPEDYGLIGMTSAVMGIIEIFKDMGLSEATIQKEEITHRQVSTLFWLNVALATVLALVVVAVAPLVAMFYQEPRVQSIMMALSINFIFSGLAVQHRALIKRQMQFGRLAKITVFTNLIAPAVAIVSAHMGNAYWALVHMFMANSICALVAIWIVCPWRPGRPDMKSGIGSMLKFGGNLTGFQFVNYFSRNLDNFLIGRVWGAAQLGLYAKAYQLVLLPINQINSPVTSVAMPALSRLQDKPDQYRRFYYKAILLITSVGMPIVCFLFAIADDVILLILGEKWLEAATIFRWLMPAAFMGTFNVSTGWVFQSLNRTDRQFRLGILTSVFNSLVFLVGVNWGAIGVAAAFGLTRPLIYVPTALYAFKGTPITLQSLFKELLYPGIPSIAAAIVLLLAKKLVFFENLIIDIFTGWIIYCAYYIFFWLLMPNGKRQMGQILDVVRSIKNK